MSVRNIEGGYPSQAEAPKLTLQQKYDLYTQKLESQVQAAVQGWLSNPFEDFLNLDRDSIAQIGANLLAICGRDDPIFGPKVVSLYRGLESLDTSPVSVEAIQRLGEEITGLPGRTDLNRSAHAEVIILQNRYLQLCQALGQALVYYAGGNCKSEELAMVVDTLKTADVAMERQILLSVQSYFQLCNEEHTGVESGYEKSASDQKKDSIKRSSFASKFLTESFQNIEQHFYGRLQCYRQAYKLKKEDLEKSSIGPFGRISRAVLSLVGNRGK